MKITFKIIMAMLLTAGTYYAHADETDEVEEQLTAVYAFNKSVETQCSEHNNVNIPLTGEVEEFLVEAIHPTYEYDIDSCEPNFENCPEGGGTDHKFEEPGTFKLYDDFETVLEVVRDEQWWQPEGMTVTVDSGDRVSDIHYLRFYKKTEDADEWPQFFVLYSDGNLRLSPLPPKGDKSVCFGSSVIIGPAPLDDRPIAQIESADFVADTLTLHVTFKDGGTAAIDLAEVNRRMARIHVKVNYADAKTPFATFRSMFVGEGNADVDHVWWKDIDGDTHKKRVDEFKRGEGSEWVFYRESPSTHNTSGPNIRIRTLN